MALQEAKAKPSVYVVDDESLIAWTLSTILNSNGFEATKFTDPLKALEAAYLFSPDLLISDVSMPDLSGVELAIRLREVSPRCKVILLSGHAATSDVLANASKWGYSFEVLPKPIHPIKLVEAARSATRSPSGS